MKRTVYLIRHGHPDIPPGERWCLGHTDLALGALGRMQAALLPFEAELVGKPVFCSYLSRAVETAKALCQEPQIRDGLEEQNMGEWDGLSFAEIQVRWPELYTARENNPDLWPDGAESMDSVQKRVLPAVVSCIEETESNPVIISHKSAIASLTGQGTNLMYGSVSTLEWDGEKLIPKEVGRRPHPPLTEEVCLALLHAAGTPEHVISHCRAVAGKAIQLLEEGLAAGVTLNRDLLFAAALLHDIARTEAEHAAIGAAWVRLLGYPEVAEVIAVHHDWTGTQLNEGAILYLADKYIQDDREVSLEERFKKSRSRCISDEAKRAHARRYETARQIEILLRGDNSHV